MVNGSAIIGLQNIDENVLSGNQLQHQLRMNQLLLFSVCDKILVTGH